MNTGPCEISDPVNKYEQWNNKAKSYKCCLCNNFGRTLQIKPMLKRSLQPCFKDTIDGVIVGGVVDP